MRTYIFLLLIFSPYFVLSQDLKTTEINVVEGLQVSVPEANKLNVKASFQDTSKIDKTQDYSFINKFLFTKFDTRPLLAAKIKKNLLYKSNIGNVNVALGNKSYRFGNINYSGRLKDSFVYGLGIILNNHDYNTKEYDYNVVRKNQSVQLHAKSILSNTIVTSYVSLENIENDHGASHDEKTKYTYSELSVLFNSRNNQKNNLQYSSELIIKDLNQQVENYIGFNTDLTKTINNFPFNLSIEFNNYLNYKNHSSSRNIQKSDVKILDVSPSISLEEKGFTFNLGFNLGIDMSDGNAADIFPLIEINKELVDNVANLTLGIDRYDYRNTLSSLSLENPYIHSFGLNTGISNDTLDYLHALETTDIYEAFISLDNKLSSNEILNFNLAYGKLLNLNYFDIEPVFVPDNFRFGVNYIDTWQLRIEGVYKRKFNNIIAMYLGANYKWFSEEVPHKTNLEANMSVPITFGEKIRFIPSFEYIGGRKYSFPSGLFIEPPQIDIISLADRYLANFEIYYSYSEKLDFSIRINNILDDQKPFWYGYEEIGFNFNLGLNYIF